MCGAEQYELGLQIGRGSYGRVFRARRRSDGLTVAVKVLPLDADDEVANLSSQVEREVAALAACESEHVLRYLGSLRLPAELWLVTELCDAGSLADIMRAHRRPLRETQLAAALTAALLALRHLHEKCLMLHRDVKAANLLLTALGELRLADFGVAVQLGSTMSKRTTVIGTPHWMAPEVIAEAPYSSSADIWSLGITAIELAEMRPPHWELKPALRALFKIPSAPPPVLSNPEVWSEEFADMLRHCLIKDPDARLSAAQLLETPFCTKVGGPTKIREVLQPLAVEVMASPLCPVNGEAGAAPAKDASATLPAGSGVEPRDRTLVRAGATRECAGGTLRPGQGAESVTTNAVDAAESAQLLEHGATAELTRTLRLSEAERLRESIALIRGEGVNIESGPQPPLGGPIDFSDGPVTPPEARLSTTAASTSAGTATIARYAGEWMDGREERGLEAHVERGLSFWEVRDDGARGSSAQPSRYHEAGDDESRTEAFPWMSPEQIAALSEEDCVQFAMCALHMSPWDGSEPFERIIGEESSTMTPRRVTLCERIAFGGPPVLLTLLFRMLTEARIATDNASRDANVPVARSLSENEPPVTSSSLGATTADGLKADTADSAASDAGERARAAAGATITASYQAELKVQRIVLKVLLIVARNAPSESIFRDQSLRETLFGLALTHDYEVRLMAVEVLRELAESDLDAARYMCSTEAMQGVLALCASAASTPASEQGLLAALELLETLLSTLIPSVPGSDVSRLRDVLPEGLEPVLNIVEEQVEPDSAAYALARDMRAYLDIEDRNYVGGPSSYLPGRRASFGNALGGLLNRAFPGGSLGKKP